MGAFGQSLIADGNNILTHCNAGALATEWGDAGLFATRKVSTESEEAGFNRTRRIAVALGADGGERVVKGTAWALSSSHNYNPNALLDFFEDPEVSKPALIEVLGVHKKDLSVHELLQRAYEMEPKEKAALFKIIEEAVELVEAAGEPGEAGREHTIREAGDLVYHLFVLLTARDITLQEVEAELARRSGVSGLEEKASRKGGL